MQIPYQKRKNEKFIKIPDKKGAEKSIFSHEKKSRNNLLRIQKNYDIVKSAPEKQKPRLKRELP